MNAYKFLFFALAIVGISFSLTYFGPGTTAYDCSVGGTVTINTPDTYLWNQTGAGQMDFQTGAWEDYCLKITTDDVVIDCTTSGGTRGTINGTDQTHALIFVADGLDNVTIRGCNLENSTEGSDGMGIQLGEDGEGSGVSNILIYNNTFFNNTYGLYAYNLTDSAITLNEFAEQTDMSVRISDFSEVIFDQNELYGATQSRGVAFGGTSSIGSGAYIYNNTIHDLNGAGYDGLALWHVEESEVLDNEVYNVDRAGIAALDTRETTFSGNIIHNNGLTSDNYAGLAIYEYNEEVVPYDVHVSDNEIYDNNGTGLNIVNLTDGTVSGNEIYATAPGEQETGLKLSMADPSTISNNEIYGNTYGIVAVDLEDISFEENNVHDQQADGVILKVSQLAQNSDVSFTDNNISSNGENGMNLTLSPGTAFTGNYIHDNGGMGVYANVSDGLSFVGNFIESNSDVGVYLYWCDEADFDSNTFFDNGDGLYLEWSWHTTVEDNEFDMNSPCGIEAINSWYSSIHSNNFTDNGGGPAVYIDDSYGDNVTSNTMDGDEYGVYIEESDEVYVGQNTLDEILDTAIYFDAGVTNSVIEGNTISNTREYGIYLSDGNANDILDNEVYLSCQDSSTPGAVFAQTTDLMNINGNDIHDNPDCDAGLFVGGSDYVAIDPNYVYNNVEGVTLDTCNYAVVEDNLFYNNSDWGIYFDSCLVATLEGNTIYENGGYGAYFNSGSDLADILDNEIYGTTAGSGLVLDQADYAELEGNTIYDNEEYGVYLFMAQDVNFTDELYYDNNGSAVYTSGSENTLMEGCTFYGNGYSLGGFYAIEGDSADGSNFTDCVFYDNYGAFFLDNSPDLEFHGITSYDNDFDAFYLTSCDNLLIADANVYEHRANGYTYYLDGCTGEIRDSVSRDHGVDTYGFEAYGCLLDLYNFEIYGNQNWHWYNDGASAIAAENLWIGYDASYGIRYGDILLNSETGLAEENAFFSREVMAINSTDALTAEFNVPANITTSVSGCSGLRHYNDTADELPETKAEIVANGETFTPAFASCSGTRATYSVDGFSGYAADGAAVDSGSSKDSMSASVSDDPKVGEEATITVTDSGKAVSGADVRLRVMVGGIYQYFDLGKTDSSGEVDFTPEYSGNYRATIEKSGYFDEDFYFEVGSFEATPECSSDSDCATGYLCTEGECRKGAEHAQEQQEEDPVPEEPECLADSDCPEGYSCEENLCVESGGIVDEPEDEAAKEAAKSAMEDALSQINSAKEKGADTSSAQEQYEMAEQAFSEGNYGVAEEYAEEALRLAVSAEEGAQSVSPEEEQIPSAPPTEEMKEEPTGQEGMDLGLVVIAAILAIGVLGGAWYFLLRK